MCLQINLQERYIFLFVLHLKICILGNSEVPSSNLILRRTCQALPRHLFSRYPCFKTFPVSRTGFGVISSSPTESKAKQSLGISHLRNPSAQCFQPLSLQKRLGRADQQPDVKIMVYRNLTSYSQSWLQAPRSPQGNQDHNSHGYTDPSSAG